MTFSATISVPLLPEPWRAGEADGDIGSQARVENKGRDMRSSSHPGRNQRTLPRNIFSSHYPYVSINSETRTSKDTILAQDRVAQYERKTNFFAGFAILDVMSGRPLEKILQTKRPHDLPYVFAISEPVDGNRSDKFFFDGARLVKTFVDHPALLKRDPHLRMPSTLTIQSKEGATSLKDPIFFSVFADDKKPYRIGSFSSLLGGPRDYLFAILAIQDFDSFDRGSSESTYSTLGALTFAGQMVGKDEARAKRIIDRIPVPLRPAALSESLIESVASDNLQLVKALMTLGASSDYKNPDDGFSALDLAIRDRKESFLKHLIGHKTSSSEVFVSTGKRRRS